MKISQRYVEVTFQPEAKKAKGSLMESVRGNLRSLIMALTVGLHGLCLTVQTQAAQRQIAYAEEYILGDRAAEILTHDEYSLGDLLQLKKVAGHTVIKSRNGKQECRFLNYQADLYQKAQLTITRFFRDQENPEKIWIEGELSGLNLKKDISDSYCANRDLIRLEKKQLQEMLGTLQGQISFMHNVYQRLGLEKSL